MNQSRHDGEGPKNGHAGRTRPNLLGATTTKGAQGAAASALGEYRILAEFDGSESRRVRAAPRAPWAALAMGALLLLGAAVAWSTWSARKAAPGVLAVAKPVTAPTVPIESAKPVPTAAAEVPSIPKPEGAAPIETITTSAVPPAETVPSVAVDKPSTAARSAVSATAKAVPKPDTNAVTKTSSKAVAKAAEKPAGPTSARPVPVDKTTLAAAGPTESLKQLPPPASSTRVQPDADEDLIAALISHLSRSKAGTATAPQATAAPRADAARTASTTATTASSVIDPLARCVAAGQSTTDCRARLCEGRWGKDVACPQPLPARP